MLYQCSVAKQRILPWQRQQGCGFHLFLHMQYKATDLDSTAVTESPAHCSIAGPMPVKHRAKKNVFMKMPSSISS